jgi:hypothetical protein
LNRGTDDSIEAEAARGWRFAYFSATGALLLIWGALAVFAAAYVAVTLGDDSAESSTVELVATATTVPTPEPTLRPRPPGAPLGATRVVDLDTGEPKQHLFFHIGCTEGVLEVVTTDEIVLAEWPCEGVVFDPQEVQPFLGKPVRIVVEDSDYLAVESPGIGKFEFNIDSAWLVPVP